MSPWTDRVKKHLWRLPLLLAGRERRAAMLLLWKMKAAKKRDRRLMMMVVMKTMKTALPKNRPDQRRAGEVERVRTKFSDLDFTCTIPTF